MSAASTLAIEASGMEKSFGTSRAVCGVDLAARRGSVYGAAKGLVSQPAEVR
jgi:ABC-2 type transport system ATP-binding protein